MKLELSFFESKKTIEIEREDNKSIGEFSLQTKRSSRCRLKAQCLIIFRFPKKAFLTIFQDASKSPVSDYIQISKEAELCVSETNKIYAKTLLKEENN